MVSNKTYEQESDLLAAVMAWITPQRKDGIAVLKIRDRYAKGYSDLFICVQGRFVIAELKDDEGEASVHQEEFIQMMKEAGAIGGICRTVKEVADFIEAAKEG